MKISSSLLAAAGLVALNVAATPASAQQKTFYVAGYGGSFEQTMRTEVIPDFEKKHGVKVEYVAGNSTDTLAKLQAQKGNQQIDVAIVDDGPMYQAIQLGFCGKLQGLPEADLYEAARFKDDLARADLVGRSEGPEVQEADRHPADQQHLRPLYAAHVREDERRR